MSEKIVCDICNEYEGTAGSVKMHRIHCLKKAEAKAAEVQPEPRQRETESRDERVPFGTPEKKLNQRKDEDGFMYYTFNDNWQKEPRRIARAEAAGYTKTEAKAVPVGTNEDGSAIMGVEMRLPIDLYEKDQAAKQAAVDVKESAIKAGTLDQQAGDRRYVPDGIKLWSSNKEER